MSPLSIASTLFSLIQSGSATSASPTSTSDAARTNAAASGDFSSSLTLRLAALQAQSFNSLLGATSGAGQTQTSSGLDLLTGASATSSQGLAGSGYNMSLFDPQSAYTMMSVINTKDVNYKAQFSELSEMKTAVAGLQQAGQTLGGVDGTMDDATITAQLQAFATTYNEWIQRFDATVKSGGLLAGTQAAEVSLNELEYSVENTFNGAKDGFRGLSDLGFSIDQTTNLASLDANALNAALASNKDGAINTLQEFSANFAKSAELLNSPDNFIPNRLGNLDRVIDYIADNKSSLQAEFGLGDAAQPSAQTAKALAAYNRILFG